jgi:hypothetical protein
MSTQDKGNMSSFGCELMHMAVDALVRTEARGMFNIAPSPVIYPKVDPNIVYSYTQQTKKLDKANALPEELGEKPE